MMSLLTPLVILLGFEKARIALVFLIVFPMVFSTKLAKLIPTIDLSNIIFRLLIILCVVTLVLVSYFITSNLYAQKDV